MAIFIQRDFSGGISRDRLIREEVPSSGEVVRNFDIHTRAGAMIHTREVVSTELPDTEGEAVWYRHRGDHLEILTNEREYLEYDLDERRFTRADPPEGNSDFKLNGLATNDVFPDKWQYLFIMYDRGVKIFGARKPDRLNQLSYDSPQADLGEAGNFIRSFALDGGVYLIFKKRVYFILVERSFTATEIFSAEQDNQEIVTATVSGLYLNIYTRPTGKDSVSKRHIIYRGGERNEVIDTINVAGEILTAANLKGVEFAIVRDGIDFNTPLFGYFSENDFVEILKIHSSVPVDRNVFYPLGIAEYNNRVYFVNRFRTKPERVNSPQSRGTTERWVFCAGNTLDGEVFSLSAEHEVAGGNILRHSEGPLVFWDNLNLDFIGESFVKTARWRSQVIAGDPFTTKKLGTLRVFADIPDGNTLRLRVLSNSPESSGPWVEMTEGRLKSFQASDLISTRSHTPVNTFQIEIESNSAGDETNIIYEIQCEYDEIPAGR